jgi:hypothetical protein
MLLSIADRPRRNKAARLCMISVTETDEEYG